MKKKKDSRMLYYLIAGYFLLWIILFEFIFPVNKVLPKPSVVLLALPDLFNVYHLGMSIFSSVSAIYLPIAAAWIVLWMFKRKSISRDSLFSHFLFSLEWFSRFVPGIILGLLIIYWFPDVEFMKYIFVFFIAFVSFYQKVKDIKNKIPAGYFESAASLGYTNTGIITWKFSETLLARDAVNLHLYLWSMLLIFEYIKGGYGLGSVLRTALTFNDISGLFASIFITGIIIWIGAAILNYYSNKYFVRE